MANFVESVRTRLADAGLDGAALVNSSPEAPEFGNAEAVFELDGLLLRFVRDRGQAFLDISSAAAPTAFQQYDDVEIAMGWTTIDEVLAKPEPEDLGAILTRLQLNLAALGDAFSGDREQLTRARVEQVARERARACADRLRGKK
jgi:hypothetical protein